MKKTTSGLSKVSYLDEKLWQNKFSEKLKYLLEKTRITQYKLSIETGIPTSTIHRYVNGYTIPSLYAAIKISKVLKCSITEFEIF